MSWCRQRWQTSHGLFCQLLQWHAISSVPWWWHPQPFLPQVVSYLFCHRNKERKLTHWWFFLTTLQITFFPISTPSCKALYIYFLILIILAIVILKSLLVLAQFFISFGLHYVTFNNKNDYVNSKHYCHMSKFLQMFTYTLCALSIK